MADFYLVTGLVQKPGMMGHRAYVGDFASKELAIGTAMEKWQVDGWSVTSFECIPCTTIALRRDLDAAEARAETAEAEIERLKDILGDPEGTIAHADAITARSETSEAALREAVEVIKPFAENAIEWADHMDQEPIAEGWAEASEHQCDLTVGDLRAAAAFLAKHGERT